MYVAHYAYSSWAECYSEDIDVATAKRAGGTVGSTSMCCPTYRRTQHVGLIVETLCYFIASSAGWRIGWVLETKQRTGDSEYFVILAARGMYVGLQRALATDLTVLEYLSARSSNDAGVRERRA